MNVLSGFRPIAAVLRNRNYGFYTAGNLISLTGTWMQRIVTGWLMWDLTQSGFWLGLVAFSDLFPTVILGPFAGAVADRTDRLRVTRFTQFLSMLQAIALFGLTATDRITPALLITLTTFLGVVAAFNQPARLALIPALVPRADISTAVAVNAIVFNLARFLGPAAAGILISTGGISIAYAVNALSFVAFLLVLAQIRLSAEEEVKPAGKRFLRDLADGIRYTVTHQGIATVLILLIASNVGSRPLLELLPGFAAEIFRSGASGLAMLTSAVGGGAILSGIWLGGRSGVPGLSRILMWSTAFVALTSALFTATDRLAVAVPLLVVTGFAMATSGVAAQTLIQVSVDASMRGRVLGIYGLLFRGGPALGALLMGAASEHFGLRLPILAGSVGVVLVWAWATARRRAALRSLDKS
ncbi:MFS transporter [Propylenella binzhouense]|uniref:MFS transporter n=1 Tax=Propylenella binzhouense TaxID=2555902 RepID=A0A964T4A7_9HYPH|nr:MFS transporter [Propylenella binzhouense]MYZ47935.1 MFS transporter [Propylenella binzhouense]